MSRPGVKVGKTRWCYTVNLKVALRPQASYLLYCIIVVILYNCICTCGQVAFFSDGRVCRDKNKINSMPSLSTM